MTSAPVLAAQRTTGIARAYRVRLTDDRDLFDIAFQQIEERVLLEPSRAPRKGSAKRSARLEV